MRRVLANHLFRYRAKISAVVATHHHEEHTGNLDWAARRLNVPLYTSAATAKELRSPKSIPRVRSWIIGRLESLPEDAVLLADRIMGNSTELEVLPAPGHSDDHVVLYDQREKLLLAGDAFMGSYFSVPNPDVDSVRWIVTLEALLQLEITTLVEGHGHIHTIRPDIPDIPGVVIREDPMQALREKLEYLKWVREQVKVGLSEGLPLGAVEATCFPWGRRSSWESFVHDSFIRLASLNHFSRAELVRSFVRHDDSAILPTVYRARFYRRDSSNSKP
jgi:glyoxylase-like metal-dependent hydrolase (beta-lactamase superfamily II)